MGESGERNLTDADVDAIVSALKTQILNDFKLEVGGGVIVWLKRAGIAFLLYLAVLGIQGDRHVFDDLAQQGGGR